MAGEKYGKGDYKATNGRLYKVSASGAGNPLAWYPAPGFRHAHSGELRAVGDSGYNWSASTIGSSGIYLGFGIQVLDPCYTNIRGLGHPLRCLSE